MPSTKVRGANSSSKCTYGAISWSAAWCDWRQQFCGSCTCAFTSQTTSLAKQVGQEKWDMTAQYYTKVPKQDCANLTMQSVAIRGKITRTIKQVQNSSDVTKTIHGAAAAADSVTSYACNSLTLLATDTLCLSTCRQHTCLSTDNRQCYVSASKTPRLSLQQLAAPPTYAVGDVDDKLPKNKIP